MQDSDSPTLIDQLDARQNDVLDQLDDLSKRVESLLDECLTTRDAENKANEPALDDIEAVAAPFAAASAVDDAVNATCEAPSEVGKQDSTPSESRTDESTTLVENDVNRDDLDGPTCQSPEAA